MDLLFGSFLFAVILTLITMVFLVKQSEAVLLYCATAVMFDIFDTVILYYLLAKRIHLSSLPFLSSIESNLYLLLYVISGEKIIYGVIYTIKYKL